MRSLLVKVTCGADDPERANQALNVAATAAVSGVGVSLWLAGDAVWFAVEGRCPDLELGDASPAAELVESVVSSGTLTVCSQCAARRGITEDDLIAGARIGGAAGFVEETLADGVQALVY